MHVDIQFYQHCLSKRLTFLHCVFLVLLSKISWPHMCWFIYGIFVLFHWFHVPGASTIMFWLLQLCNIAWNQELWCLQFCSFFLRITLAIWGLLWLHRLELHTNFRIIFIYFCEKCHWTFHRDYMDSLDHFSVVWRISQHQFFQSKIMGYLSIYLYLPQSHQCFMVFSVCLSPTWLNLFVSILLLLMLL